MTDDKKTLMPPPSPPPEEEGKKSDETDAEILARTPLKNLLIAATDVINQARIAGLPLLAIYKVPCQCGAPGCKTMLSVTITPYTEVYYDSLRSIQ